MTTPNTPTNASKAEDPVGEARGAEATLLRWAHDLAENPYTAETGQIVALARAYLDGCAAHDAALAEVGRLRGERDEARDTVRQLYSERADLVRASNGKMPTGPENTTWSLARRVYEDRLALAAYDADAVKARTLAADGAPHEEIRAALRPHGPYAAAGAIDGVDNVHDIVKENARLRGERDEAGREAEAATEGFAEIAEKYRLTAGTLHDVAAEAQRLRDLVRHQRSELHDEGLIDDAEYAALASDHGAVARLHGYDHLRSSLTTAEERCRGLERELMAERGEGEPRAGWRASFRGGDVRWVRETTLPNEVFDAVRQLDPWREEPGWHWWRRIVDRDGDVIETLAEGRAATALAAIDAAEASMAALTPTGDPHAR